MKNLETVLIKEVMKHEQNILNTNWLCWIPGTPQAYYYPTKKKAEQFCNNVNKAFDLGKLKIDGRGMVIKVNIKVES